jgi:hypothetical protein
MIHCDGQHSKNGWYVGSRYSSLRIIDIQGDQVLSIGLAYSFCGSIIGPAMSGGEFRAGAITMKNDFDSSFWL